MKNVSVFALSSLLLFGASLHPVLGQTQMQMNQQSNLDYQKAEQDLSSVYAKLFNKISADGQKSLRAAEDAWVQFRDLECSFETLGSVGGSVHPMILNKCKEYLTRRRITDFDRQINCDEGNTSCGNQ